MPSFFRGVRLRHSFLPAALVASAIGPQLPASAPRTDWSWSEKGLTYTAPADSSWTLRIRPRLQLDARWFPDEDTDPEGVFRRFRPVVQGSIGRVTWRVMPELANTAKVLDAWIDLPLAPELNLRLGKFKGVMGLERRQSFSRTLFLERGFPSLLTPTREVGLELQGKTSAKNLHWSFGLYQGSPDDCDRNGNDDGHGLDLGFLVERGLSPGLTIGLAATWGQEEFTIENTKANQRLRLRTSGRATFFRYADGALVDGPHWRINPSLQFYRGPFSILSEYVISHYTLQGGPDDRWGMDTNAWTVQCGWVLTGEDAGFDGPRPKHPFALGKPGWGALEAGLRFHGIEADADAFDDRDGRGSLARAGSTRRAVAFGGALHWHLTAHLMVGLDVEHTTFGGRAAARPDEDLVLGRIQLDY